MVAFVHCLAFVLWFVLLRVFNNVFFHCGGCFVLVV